jgi:hypothetical protein
MPPKKVDQLFYLRVLFIALDKKTQALVIRFSYTTQLAKKGNRLTLYTTRSSQKWEEALSKRGRVV